MNADLEAERVLRAHRNNRRVASRVPALGYSAFALLGLMVFSFFYNAVLIAAIADGQASLFSFPATLLTIATAGVAIGLLVTRSMVVAERLLIAVGLSFVVAILVSVIDMSLLGAAIDGLLLWWTYELYNRVQDLT